MPNLLSNFLFLRAEWPEIFESAAKVEKYAGGDPRTACFHARRTVELIVHRIYHDDASLNFPYQDNLSALIHEPSFKRAAGCVAGDDGAIFAKINFVVRTGNNAAHTGKRITGCDALNAARELFHVAFWFARTYARGAKPPADAKFSENALAASAPEPAVTREQFEKLEADNRESDKKYLSVLADKDALDAELVKLRAEIAAAKAANCAVPDTHDYNEAATRALIIDGLLREAGWKLDAARDREFPVTGMPTAAGDNTGNGFVDYVLWGDDGKPLAVVEAKRAERDARVGQQQAKLYADCLEKQFGRRPLIFYTNGYEHYFWDDAFYPPRRVAGFFTKDELALRIQRRATRRSLAGEKIDESIAGRYYQTRAVRRVSEAFERDNERKALLVMATGSGKTRTVIALCDLLVRANWAKHILFLADRVALVKQAAGQFKKFLPDASPVNLCTEKDTDGRVCLATYPTMMNLIDKDVRADGTRRFGTGHFDVIVIDEAHRSVYQKYRAIFEYFDTHLVGLTATPKSEIDRDTYELFELERGVPTDAYDLDAAVADKFLVPPKSISVPLKFQREGIKYKDLSDDEKARWEALEWDEKTPDSVPDEVSADAVNNWLFNEDTVDKVLEYLMRSGQKVAGGDRLGKTIIFAKNQAHADFIAGRFDKNYPHLRGQFARVITFKTEYAQSLIDDFSKKESAPHIAISVDMLDTGIDVPEIVNLVFFKLVRSKTKFWQMLGRGTRLCPDLFGPGDDKKFFSIFDFCQNLEYFGQNPDAADPAGTESLATRLFKARLELVAGIDKKFAGGTGNALGIADALERFRNDVAGFLRREVAAMPIENFIVRPHRRLVERFTKPEAWQRVSGEDFSALAKNVAGLPAAQEPEPEEAKRFDLLMLRLQLVTFNSEPAFTRLRDEVIKIARLLEEIRVPAVQAHLVLIQSLQTGEFWEDVSLQQLDRVRLNLRGLIHLIESKKRKIIYVDFEDEIDSGKELTLPGTGGFVDLEQFRKKARDFLRAHEDHIAIHRLRMNLPLMPADLQELERMLLESGAGNAAALQRATEESHGLGLFVRSLVGMDREAAKTAFAGFLAGKNFSAAQIEFVNLIIDRLTAGGVVEREALYEMPFTFRNSAGIDGLFSAPAVQEIFALLDEINRRATA